jgi:hypothetical protein
MSGGKKYDAGSDGPMADDPATREIPVKEKVGGTTAERDGSAFKFRQQDDESIPQLLRRLADQGSHLAQQQGKLIEAEVRSSVGDLKEAVGAMAGAAVVGIAGLGVLLMGISFLLAEFMDLWLATLLVAAATLAGAYAMFTAGRKKLQSSSFSADRSRRTLERAPGAISGNTNEEPQQ